MFDRQTIEIAAARHHLEARNIRVAVWSSEDELLSSILAKLGVHSQLQALAFALRYDVVKIN